MPDASWKIGRIEKLVASLRSRDDIWRQEVWLLQIEFYGQTTSRAENQICSFPSEISRRGQTCNCNSERGECIRWTTEDQCSSGEACASTHDPNKKGKGKGRPRSPCPTGSPRLNSTGDGKGSDDGSAKGTPKVNWTTPVRKSEQTTFVQSSRREVSEGEVHVIIGMFVDVQNSKR